MQNQILGHSSSRIYEQHYQDLRVQHDVQNAFIGVPTDDKLLKIANLMSRTIDPRTPRTLNRAEIAEIEDCSQELQHLMLEASDAKAQCLQRYKRLKDGKGTPLYQRHVVAKSNVQALSRRLRKEALAAKQEHFEKFAAIPSSRVIAKSRHENQLAGSVANSVQSPGGRTGKRPRDELGLCLVASIGGCLDFCLAGVIGLRTADTVEGVIATF